jgi:hypothetical protein
VNGVDGSRKNPREDDSFSRDDEPQQKEPKESTRKEFREELYDMLSHQKERKDKILVDYEAVILI